MLGEEFEKSSQGANVEVEDQEGRTALDLANEFDHTEGADAILQQLQKNLTLK